MDRTEQAIIKTLVYADIFGSAISRQVLWKYLIEARPSYTHFSIAVEQLHKKRKIIIQAGFYALSSQHEKILQSRKRIITSERKVALAQKYARLLSLLPWVWYVGISGAVAVENAPETDDIDFFIIASPGRIWLVRFFCVLLLDLVRVRRTPGMEQVKNKICLNMFMDAAQLSFPRQERDLFTAHEITQLRTLVNKHQIYELFLHHNQWIQRFLPQVKLPVVQLALPVRAQRGLVHFLEHLFQQLQLVYMQKRKTTEVTQRFVIRFHPQDVRQAVLVAYAARLKKYRLKP